MYGLKNLSKIFESAQQIPFDDSSKIVIMSDCHRGDGSWADTFFKNQSLYFVALNHYYNNKFTYIEMGDGDELWENNKLSDIIQVHSDVFWLLSKFYKEERLHFLYGNHDIVKKDESYVKKNLYYYFNERINRYIPLFKDIKIHEGLVLKHKDTLNKIFLVHGHQVDFFNDKMWRMRKFLVRYLWRPLEIWGINDPTRTARNYKKRKSVGKKLTQWVLNENQMMIAGHTHRPVFPKVGEPNYFNDGSCVHPRCITGIEIVEGYIMLIKWAVKTKKDGTMFIDREVLAGPKKLNDYFNYNSKSRHSLKKILNT